MPRHDHYARGTFGSSFGGSVGCVLGTAFAIGLLMIGGFIACAGIFGFGCWGAKEVSDRVEEIKKEQEKKTEASAVGVGPDQWSEVGYVRMRIAKVTVGQPTLVDRIRDEESVSNEAYLQVVLHIQNLSKTKKIEYMPPHGRGLLGEAGVTLKDEHGNDYSYRRFDGLTQVKGAVRGIQTINPGDPLLTDILCFQPPVDAATVLRLSVDSPITGARHEFRIPASAWKE